MREHTKSAYLKMPAEEWGAEWRRMRKRMEPHHYIRILCRGCGRRLETWRPDARTLTAVIDRWQRGELLCRSCTGDLRGEG